MDTLKTVRGTFIPSMPARSRTPESKVIIQHLHRWRLFRLRQVYTYLNVFSEPLEYDD